MTKRFLLILSVLLFFGLGSEVNSQVPNESSTVQSVAASSENWANCQKGNNSLVCHLFVREVQRTLNPSCSLSGWGLLTKKSGENQCTETQCGKLDGSGFGEDVIAIMRNGAINVVDIITDTGGPNPRLSWQVLSPGSRVGNDWFCGGVTQTGGPANGNGNGNGGGGGDGPGPDNQPQIFGINPSSARPGDTVTINGTNLTANVRLELVPGGATYTINASLNSSKTSATFQIPGDVPLGTYSLTVSGQDGSATSPVLLTVGEQPVIEPAPPIDTFAAGDLINDIFRWALTLVGLAIFANFLYAGLLWFSAAGRPGPIVSAKEKMVNSLIGAIILLAAYLILNTINPDLVRQTFILPGL